MLNKINKLELRATLQKFLFSVAKSVLYRATTELFFYIDYSIQCYCSADRLPHFAL